MRGQAYDMFRISVGRVDRAGVAQGVFFIYFFIDDWQNNFTLEPTQNTLATTQSTLATT